MSKYVNRTFKYYRVSALCADITNPAKPVFATREFNVDSAFSDDVSTIADIAGRVPGCVPVQIVSRKLCAEKRRMLTADFIRLSEFVADVNPDTVKDED